MASVTPGTLADVLPPSSAPATSAEVRPIAAMSEINLFVSYTGSTAYSLDIETSPDGLAWYVVQTVSSTKATAVSPVIFASARFRVNLTSAGNGSVGVKALYN
jgi:hypothetical protein